MKLKTFRAPLVAICSTLYLFLTSCNPLSPNATSDPTILTSYAVVSYDGNGNTEGSIPTDTHSPYDFGSTVTVLGNTGGLSKPRYFFAGWNTSSDGSGTFYAPGATFSASQNTTLYAVYVLAGNRKWMTSLQMFVVDTAHHLIRIVDRTSGIISAFVGTGVEGTSANGTAIASAQLNAPNSLLAVDDSTIIYTMARQGCVQKVSGGVVTTIAGTCGTYSTTTYGGLARNALLNNPAGICMDSLQNLYVTDNGNSQISKIDHATGIISLYGGTGVFGYDSSLDGGPAVLAPMAPTDCAFDASDNLYFINPYFSVIQKIDTNGIISTIAGNGTNGSTGNGGLAVNALMHRPANLDIDQTRGILYFSDRTNQVVRQINLNTGLISAFAGVLSSPGYNGDLIDATTAQLFLPDGIATNGTDVFVADGNNSRIRKIDRSGTISTVVGNGFYGNTGNSGLATAAAVGYLYSWTWYGP